MIPAQLFRKKISSTRTYKYRIYDNLAEPFKQVQTVRRLYFNYALKYLYQHYGSKHLDHYLPTGKKRQYLIRNLVEFARKKVRVHGIDLKKMDYSVQSIDKMVSELLVAFEKYRRQQYGIQYWSEKNKLNFLTTHNCSLSGYGRISYKHNNEDFKSVTFKQNHNRIDRINNYLMKVPYFGIVHTKRSMIHLKHKKIVEARIIKRSNGDFVLQVVTKFEKQKELSPKDRQKLVGLDINLAHNYFFQLSKKMKSSEKTWSKSVYEKYLVLDDKARRLQHYLTSKGHRFDGSQTTRRIKGQLARIRARNANLLDAWQLQKAKEFSHKYPILAMEQLDSFTMRMSRRSKDYWLRKNTNHKLATFQPTSFKKMMEYIYQDDGHLLLEVDSYDTSKACNKCGKINEKLKVGVKEWTCPNCGQVLDRDFNASLNIKNWAQDITKHPKHGKTINGHKVKDSDLLLVF